MSDRMNKPKATIKSLARAWRAIVSAAGAWRSSHTRSAASRTRPNGSMFGTCASGRRPMRRLSDWNLRSVVAHTQYGGSDSTAAGGAAGGGRGTGDASPHALVGHTNEQGVRLARLRRRLPLHERGEADDARQLIEIRLHRAGCVRRSRQHTVHELLPAVLRGRRLSAVAERCTTRFGTTPRTRGDCASCGGQRARTCSTVTNSLITGSDKNTRATACISVSAPLTAAATSGARAAVTHVSSCTARFSEHDAGMVVSAPPRRSSCTGAVSLHNARGHAHTRTHARVTPTHACTHTQTHTSRPARATASPQRARAHTHQ